MSKKDRDAKLKEMSEQSGLPIEVLKAREQTFRNTPQQSPQLQPTSYGDGQGKKQLCQTFERAQNISLKEALDVAGTSQSLQNQRWDNQIAQADGSTPAASAPAPGCGN